MGVWAFLVPQVIIGTYSFGRGHFRPPVGLHQIGLVQISGNASVSYYVDLESGLSDR